MSVNSDVNLHPSPTGPWTRLKLTLRTFPVWVLPRSCAQLKILDRVSVTTIVLVPIAAEILVALGLSLPWALSALFFAAVASLGGQMVFSLGAPQIIERHSREKFVEAQLQRLSENDPTASDHAEAVLQSGGPFFDQVWQEFDQIGPIIQRAKTDPLAAKKALETLKFSQLSALAEALDRRDDKDAVRLELAPRVEQLLQRRALQKGVPEAERARVAGRVALAAKVQYESELASRHVRALLASAGYVAAAVLIASVLCHQAVIVARAAQLRGVVDLFWPR